MIPFVNFGKDKTKMEYITDTNLIKITAFMYFAILTLEIIILFKYCGGDPVENDDEDDDVAEKSD